MSASDSGRILIVDDEPEVADAYALQLRQQHDVETAYGGEEALDEIDDSIDVVLLDRRMPMSGDETLEVIRDQGYDCRVIMVTAVIDPDFDIVDMPFDDYLCKPVDQEDLFAAVDQQLEHYKYDQRVNEYFELSSKIAVLEAEKTPEELADSDRYEALKDQVEQLSTELEKSQENFDDMVAAFQSIDRGSG